jgi:hypothetical protein
MSRSIRKTHPGTFAAFAVIAAGLTGTIVDNNGKAGLALFVAGAAGVVFLIGRQLARSLSPRVATAKAHRPQLAPRGPVPSIVSRRTIAIAVVVMSVLLLATNVFKATDDDALNRALNYGAWYGFLLFAISLVGVLVITASRWLFKPTVADPVPPA